MDPPYWGGENDYGKGLFDRSQFEKMAGVLAGIRGKFLLSINDRPEIRELFAAFRFEEVSLKYTVFKRGGDKCGGIVSSPISRSRTGFCSLRLRPMFANVPI
ncbi:hypothetical protein [Leisingera sp. M658]|uniref:hypothetical protein n=1 Tax=Leisingera sp. M658 TaxID=2867015 RepID=UPI00288347D3|nr:hypothetical protein [Leisingera sp. M658]